MNIMGSLLFLIEFVYYGIKGKMLLVVANMYVAQFTNFSCVLYRKMNQTCAFYSTLYNLTNLNQIINYFILSYHKINYIL